ncbi:response regulator [Anatilimnocola floriformis]|uniref:response regulator n=1 Tax=Anatilimnocola floriformis TaxID=2948575 RepID=UPI0020C5AF26|nr:response regulator [Anatilimnocola floriformis]
MTTAPVYFLLVDDLEENLVALEALLRREGRVLLRARSGADALELLLQHEVALALVDVQMPGMNGFELAELMRGTERTRRVPIIFLTAGVSDKQRRFQGYEAGAVDFLQKPIDSEILRSKADVFAELYLQRHEAIRQRDEISRLLEEARKNTEALKEADRRKDEFLAMLAHELRNPLAPIRNAIEILRYVGLPTETEKVINILDRQAQQLSRLVDDLLDVSRVSRGKIELRKETLPLAMIVANAVEASRPLINRHKHRLIVNVADEDCLVQGDGARLTQVVMNLLNNAAKYTDDEGTIWLTATCDQQQFSVSVRDNGIGISAEMLPKVFDLFTQVDRTLERTEGGLGIGLTLVKRLVELHQGTVVARSEGHSKGSEFAISIPREKPTISSPQTTVRPTPESAAIARARVLVVDDNRDSAESLVKLLQVLGYEVQVAFDGAQAVNTANHWRPTVIFMDIGLPILNGYEAARQIRSDLGASTILVALTGWGQESDRLQSKHAGFNHHLTKPVEFETLRMLIQQAAE